MNTQRRFETFLLAKGDTEIDRQAMKMKRRYGTFPFLPIFL